LGVGVSDCIGNMPHRDPIKPWYDAIGQTGDYVMIRFGRIKPGSEEVEWMSLPHCEFDGIGGFGHFLRGKGVELDELPTNRHLQKSSWWPFFRSLPKQVGPRHQLKWKDFPRDDLPAKGELPDPVLAWHVFSEEDTAALRTAARGYGVTLNSFLLKQLDTVVRADLVEQKAMIPWMVPVNLRGQVKREDDTENHSSYLSIRVSSDETEEEVHGEIYRKLKAGEHWANWKGYSATRFIPAFVKRAMIRRGRAMAEWNLGLFTNLGVWDPGCEINHEDIVGSWMVAATVLRCQTLGAGLMTFQGRLSLTLQAHPELTTSKAVLDGWLGDWLEMIRTRAAEV
jgi:hypothetical protein